MSTQGSATGTRFERDTAVVRETDQRFAARIDRGWWIAAGPNGGYVTAILLRAMQATVDDAERRPRSLTVHFVSPPREGAAQVETAIERSGGRLSTASARLLQDDRLLAVAVGAFSLPRSGDRFQHDRPPQVAAFDELPLWQRPPAQRIEFQDRWEMKPCIGAMPRQRAGEAVSGGWIRPAEAQPLDACLLAAATDAWPPALFAMLDADAPSMAVPTVELTVHFRASAEQLASVGESPLLCRFRTRTAADGFIEEDGEVWSEDGALLAQSRQLAVLI